MARANDVGGGGAPQLGTPFLGAKTILGPLTVVTLAWAGEAWSA